jgi:rare lipoprotein A
MLVSRQILCLLPVCALALLTACVAGTYVGDPASRYSMDTDIGPADDSFDVSAIPDAIPRHETRTLAGNKSPYTVLGETYYVLDSPEGFRQQGVASWYGKKFHGHQTSNGEIYSMYGMTAAHKTLPIPSYVRVTNLDNGRQAVVRINDRGPFHDGRIIDLSWAAAKKLGYAGQGTANVTLEVIPVDAGLAASGAKEPATGAAGSATLVPGQGYFVQVGAYASADSAHKVKKLLETWISDPVEVNSTNETGVVLYRVRVGPWSDRMAAEKLQQNLEKRSFGNPIIIVRPVAERAAG